MQIAPGVMDLVVSPSKGTPIWDPTYYDPYYGDLLKDRANLGEPPLGVLGLWTRASCFWA